ncbi:MAG: hypothetical protein FE78DRAFT_69136 [Acidomyces sp. 'richmondensis']|nr:MAG: hypothetical protein FE78DRAFT_69136 [Acidomyces sp. 'richmondensis']
MLYRGNVSVSAQRLSDSRIMTRGSSLDSIQSEVSEHAAESLLQILTPLDINEQMKISIAFPSHSVLVNGVRGKNMLHQFVKTGQELIVKWLLACGAEVNAIDHKHRTPLFIAASQGPNTERKRMIFLLASAGARLDDCAAPPYYWDHYVASYPELKNLGKREKAVENHVEANEHILLSSQRPIWCLCLKERNCVKACHNLPLFDLDPFVTHRIILEKKNRPAICYINGEWTNSDFLLGSNIGGNPPLHMNASEYSLFSTILMFPDRKNSFLNLQLTPLRHPYSVTCESLRCEQYQRILLAMNASNVATSSRLLADVLRARTLAIRSSHPSR